MSISRLSGLAAALGVPLLALIEQPACDVALQTISYAVPMRELVPVGV